MSGEKNKVIKLGISIVLAAVLVFFSFKSIDWTAFLQNLKCTKWAYIALFMICVIAALLIRAFRWKIMLRPLDAKIKTSTTWHANNIGNLTNSIIPGSGELVRCAFACKGGANYDSVLGTEVMERSWDALAILLLAIIALFDGSESVTSFFKTSILAPLSSHSSNIIWILCGIAAIALFVCICFKFRHSNAILGKIADFLCGIGKGFVSFRNMKNKGAFLSLTVMLWVFYILMYYFILKAVPALSELNILDALLLSVVGNLASVIPVPGGIGAYHYLIALCLSSIYGIEWSIGILFATLQHELHAVILIAFGIISYFQTNIKKSSQ